MEVATVIPAQPRHWDLESQEYSCARDKINFLLRLIDSQIEAALIICDSDGRVLWANDYALSVANVLGIFCHAENDLVIENRDLEKLIVGDSLASEMKSRHIHFIKNGCLFEVARLASLEKDAEPQLIGLVIRCYAFVTGDDRELNALSPAEYSLIYSLVSHQTLKQSAVQLDISYENARTTLKHIFHKLNVHSQSELLKMFSCIDRSDNPTSPLSLD
jgi:DNA-binding CsgD family transcriptional regulator